MIESIQEYQYENNLPVAQLVINFFQEDIVILGENLPMSQWIEISDKKTLLENTFQSHEFGFLGFGQGLITDLVDNGEFLRYVLGKIQEKIPLVFSSMSSWTFFTQSLVYEYAYNNQNQEKSLEYRQEFPIRQAPYPFQALDLIGIKSLVFQVLKEFHLQGITYRSLQAPILSEDPNTIIEE